VGLSLPGWSLGSVGTKRSSGTGQDHLHETAHITVIEKTNKGNLLLIRHGIRTLVVMVGCLRAKIPHDVRALALMDLKVVFREESSHLFASQQSPIPPIQPAKGRIRFKLRHTCQVLPHLLDILLVLRYHQQIRSQLTLDYRRQCLIHSRMRRCLSPLKLILPLDGRRCRGILER
jgi:hypothetical protein